MWQQGRRSVGTEDGRRNAFCCLMMCRRRRNNAWRLCAACLGCVRYDQSVMEGGEDSSGQGVACLRARLQPSSQFSSLPLAVSRWADMDFQVSHRQRRREKRAFRRPPPGGLPRGQHTTHARCTDNAPEGLSNSAHSRTLYLLCPSGQ